MSVTDEFLASTFDEIERDIGDMIEISNRKLPAIHIVSKIHQPLPKGPMPDYVEHKEGVNQVGKLSAEAVVREYDAFWTAHEARIRTIKARIESKWRRLASR